MELTCRHASESVREQDLQVAKEWRRKNTTQYLASLKNVTPEDIPTLMPLLDEMGFTAFVDK